MEPNHETAQHCSCRRARTGPERFAAADFRANRFGRRTGHEDRRVRAKDYHQARSAEKFEMEDGMTMVFRAQDPAMLKTVKPGDKVKFVPERINGQFTVTKIQKAK